MKVFKPVLLAGMVLATSANAQTFVPFHSGVNLSAECDFRHLLRAYPE